MCRETISRCEICARIVSRSAYLRPNFFRRPSRLSTFDGTLGAVRQANIDVVVDYLCLSRPDPRENAVSADDRSVANGRSRSAHFPDLPSSFSLLLRRAPFFTTPITCRAMERLRGIDEWVPLPRRAIFDSASICPRNRITVASTSAEASRFSRRGFSQRYRRSRQLVHLAFQ